MTGKVDRSMGSRTGSGTAVVVGKVVGETGAEVGVEAGEAWQPTSKIVITRGK
jgi:hypothetical protein